MAANDAIVDVAEPHKYTRADFICDADSFTDFQIPGLNEYMQCPGCIEDRVRVMLKFNVKGAIICLNDNHGWTREQIADWLDSLDIDLTIKEK